MHIASIQIAILKAALRADGCRNRCDLGNRGDPAGSKRAGSKSESTRDVSPEFNRVLPLTLRRLPADNYVLPPDCSTTCALIAPKSASSTSLGRKLTGLDGVQEQQLIRPGPRDKPFDSRESEAIKAVGRVSYRALAGIDCHAHGYLFPGLVGNSMLTESHRCYRTCEPQKYSTPRSFISVPP